MGLAGLRGSRKRRAGAGRHRMHHVAIVVHRHDRLENNTYWLRLMAECWRDDGIQVSVVADPKARIEADAAILHVDRTIVPPDYLGCVRRCAVTVNGAVSDISKRVISTNLLCRGDRHDGPVIVKTDRNCAGRPEMRLARIGWATRDRGTILESALAQLTERYRGARRRWRHGSKLAFLNYRVFPSMAEVPDAVWHDRELVVERFLPERIDGRYAVRTWLFFGDQDRHTMFYSRVPIVKAQNIIGYDRLAEVPAALRQMRRDLKFDFGKFDYTMVDNRPVLFDANRTPMIGNFPRDRYLPIARSLADGIGAFLRGPRAAAPAQRHGLETA